jgi:Tat protein secretion system quality control protein TatD with DNase activity
MELPQQVRSQVQLGNEECDNPDLIGMRYIEPHAHMVSRVTDDYAAMVTAGCRAVCEPAFWAGFDRGSAQGFHDYFRQLTDYEPRRAAQFGLPHYCWLCLNPKEAENLALADEVLAMIPSFLDRPNVLGIGEIGLNKNSRNEIAVFEKHVDLAVRHGQMILVHTPHLEDKWKGTRLIIDILKQNRVSGRASRSIPNRNARPRAPSTWWKFTGRSASGSIPPAIGAKAIPSPFRKPPSK